MGQSTIGIETSTRVFLSPFRVIVRLRNIWLVTLFACCAVMGSKEMIDATTSVFVAISLSNAKNLWARQLPAVVVKSGLVMDSRARLGDADGREGALPRPQH